MVGQLGRELHQHYAFGFNPRRQLCAQLSHPLQFQLEGLSRGVILAPERE